jgi:hypothetical protein
MGQHCPSHVQIVRVIALTLWTDCLFGLATKLAGDANLINSEQGIADRSSARSVA